MSLRRTFRILGRPFEAVGADYRVSLLETSGFLRVERGPDLLQESRGHLGAVFGGGPLEQHG